MNDTNVTAAQQAGQAALDSVPGLGLLANIPGTTFDQAKVEVFVGLENTGSQLNNAIDGHYNVKTNFYVSGGVTLGANPHTLGSVMGGAGLRRAWTFWEVWGGLQGGRDFYTGTWAGQLLGGIAYKPLSGMAIYFQPAANFDKNLFTGKASQVSNLSLKLGVAFAF